MGLNWTLLIWVPWWICAYFRQWLMETKNSVIWDVGVTTCLSNSFLQAVQTRRLMTSVPPNLFMSFTVRTTLLNVDNIYDMTGLLWRQISMHLECYFPISFFCYAVRNEVYLPPHPTDIFFKTSRGKDCISHHIMHVTFKHSSCRTQPWPSRAEPLGRTRSGVLDSIAAMRVSENEVGTATVILA